MPILLLLLLLLPFKLVFNIDFLQTALNVMPNCHRRFSNGSFLIYMQIIFCIHSGVNWKLLSSVSRTYIKCFFLSLKLNFRTELMETNCNLISNDSINSKSILEWFLILWIQWRMSQVTSRFFFLFEFTFYFDATFFFRLFGFQISV